MRLCVWNMEQLPHTVSQCAAMATSLPFGDGEAERISAFGNTDAARRSLGALLALDKLVSELPRNRLTLRRAPSGKPYFPLLAKTGFSLTHVGAFCAAALDDRQAMIGIDLEEVDEKRPYRKVAERFFTREEQSTLANAKDPLLCFYKLWTQKEAVAKMSGEGLFRGPSHTPPCFVRHLRLTTDKSSFVLCLAAREPFDLKEIQLPTNMKQEELP